MLKEVLCSRKRNSVIYPLLALVLFCSVAMAEGQDWPEWRGPDRDGISLEAGWLPQFPPEGPKQLWTASLGNGCSSFSVVGNKVYSIGNVNDVETVYCLNPKTGKPIWTYDYPCETAPKNFEGGPGATPTVADGKVYTFSRMGHLHCLDAETGKLIWSKKAQDDWGAKEPTWGFACSPLVLGQKLILIADRTLALDKDTGEVIWQTAKVGGNYSSPYEFKMNDKSYLAIFSAPGLLVLETETGKELLRFPWKTSYDVNAATPIYHDGKIFISSGYNTGCALIDISSGKPEVIYQNKDMRNHFATCVLWEGNLYGFDENTLTCMKWDTGEVRWTERGLGKGTVLLAGKHLIVLSERGELVTAPVNPSAFKEISRAEILNNRCWVVPVLSHGQLYCKDNEGETVCFDMTAD